MTQGNLGRIPRIYGSGWLGRTPYAEITIVSIRAVSEEKLRTRRYTNNALKIIRLCLLNMKRAKIRKFDESPSLV